MNRLRIVVFGRIPPPIGGVTVFIKNLIEAGKKSRSTEITLFNIKALALKRFDAAHINASHPVKRLILLILGKLIARRVYFTIHGGKINEGNPFNILSLKISNGVYCLNKAVQLKLEKLKINNFIHTTIFKENTVAINSSARREGDTKKILLYINNCNSIDGEEIYGATFFASCITKIVEKSDFETIIVDLSGSYRDTFKPIPRTIYHDKPVNFKELLSQCDIYVRPTSTDGMSVALLEAGSLGIPTLASDIVDRPSFVETYKHSSETDFITKLQSMLTNKKESNKTPVLTSIEDFVFFMRDQ